MTTRCRRSKRIELLVAGYVRSIEAILNKIIPDSITLICLSYYNITKYILCLDDDFKKRKMYITTINDDISSNAYECTIKQLNTIAEYKTVDQMWSLVYVGLCHQANISIPTIIHQQYCQQTSTIINNDYNVVFKCCGNDKGFTSYCSAILINTQEFAKTRKYESNLINITAYNWDLPQYPKKTDYNACIYSSKYNELYGIGGWQCQDLYKLSFNQTTMESLNQWKWEKLPSMKEGRAYPAISLIDNDNNNEQKLIVIGGYVQKPSDTVELYDFNKQQWCYIKSTNIKIYQAGSYYDKYNKYVYLGGGLQGDLPNSRKAAYLDLGKEKWISLHSTIERHWNKPVLWIDDVNKLYIASSSCLNIESIDIRENIKWKIDKKNGLLSKMFRRPIVGSHSFVLM